MSRLSSQAALGPPAGGRKASPSANCATCPSSAVRVAAGLCQRTCGLVCGLILITDQAVPWYRVAWILA